MTTPFTTRRNLLLAMFLITLALWALAQALARSGDAHGLTPIFFFLFTTGDTAGLQSALVILIAAACVPGSWHTGAFLEWLGRHPGRVALASAVVLACGARFAYLDAPLSMDEYTAVFQSRVFAAGHLSGKFPPVLMDWLIPRGFQNYFLNVVPDTGRVSSSYWPSFALLLTPFTWLGIPWVCNPLLSGLTVVLVHRLALAVFEDAQCAGLAVLLTIASPVFFADGISYYSMTAHLLANTLFALLLVAPTPRKVFAAGLVGSIALTLHNPVPHMLFALPWLVSLMRRPGRIKTLLTLCAGYLPLCLVLGLGWFLWTTPTGDAAAHVSAPFAWPSATVLLARGIGLVKLWAWAVPGLVVLAGVGGWKWRHNRTCRLLASSAVLTLVGYVFVPFDQGHGWGYRYFHSAWIALPILAVAALRVPPPSPGRAVLLPPREPQRVESNGTLPFVVACALLSLIAGTGLRALQIRRFVIAHQSQMPAYSGTESRVVILDTHLTFYGRDLIQNDPWLRGNPVMMITRGARADAVMMHAYFPRLHLVYTDNHGSVWSAAVK